MGLNPTQWTSTLYWYVISYLALEQQEETSARDNKQRNSDKSVPVKDRTNGKAV
jgi:hypothetical protein